MHGIKINRDSKPNFISTLMSIEWTQRELSNMNGKI